MIQSIEPRKLLEEVKKNPELARLTISVFEEMVEIRRDLRKHPELSFQERRTASIVANYLKQWGYEVKEGVGGTGVIGLLKGKNPGKVIALRADMDALPMPDEIAEDYKSIHENTAHTCGHDVHTTNLLGVARIFSELGLEKGTLKLIFQPAEEIGAGAAAMIEDGALLDPPVDFMAGLHVSPLVNVGNFSTTKFEYSGAAVDTFELTVTGRGGHAAHPHLAIDPVMITAQILVALQQIVSRQVDPLDSVVLSISQIHGGTKDNILPNSVKVSGTVRTLLPKTREVMPKRMEQIASHVAMAFGGRIHLDYLQVTPSVRNDEFGRQFLEEAVDEMFGNERLIYSNPSMGGEDFAYFSQKVPSIFFRLGTSSGESTSVNLHNTKFNVDEEALKYGMTLLSYMVIKYLNKEEE